jgi:ABC-2 type transport system ATP-binding protein
MIEVAKLTKRYGLVPAVRDLSFRVRPGELVGFLGPNGAGKTTTLRILAGFLGPTSGQARIAGHDVVADPDAARRSIGYMPEGTPLYPELRVREYLSYRARLKRIDRRRRASELDRVLELSGAAEVGGMLNGQLSRGYRQRVGLADALLGSPPLLILDEPTAGLDPNQVGEVRSLLRSLAGKQTVLLSTHVLSEVEASCTRAIVIARGQLVAEGPIDELRRLGSSSGRLRLVVRGEPGPTGRLLASLVGRDRVSKPAAGNAVADAAEAVHEWLVEVEPAEGESSAERAAGLAEQLAAQITAAGYGLRRLEPVRTSLEQIFAELTRPPSGDPNERSAPAAASGDDAEPPARRRAPGVEEEPS